jgi:hypothetical protein
VKWGLGAGDLALLGLEGDKAAALCAGEREDHLHAARADAGPQMFQAQPTARHDVSAYV